jgi:hypothetical protein
MHCPCSGTCTVPVPVPALQVIRYSKSSGTRRFYSQPYLHSHPVPTLHVIQYHTSSTNTALIRTPCHLVPTRPVPILLKSSGTRRSTWYLHSHLVPILHVIWYPHSMSSSTQLVRYQYCAHPVLQVIWYQKVLQSTGTCTVIWYPYSMSSGTHTPCHPVLSSSGTNTALIRYSKSSGTRRFYNQPVPAQSSSTHTPCHLVPTLHVIQYSYRPVPILCSSGTNVVLVWYQHQQQFGTRNNSKFWKASRGKSGTWVLSRATFTCGNMRKNSPISHVWTSISGE